MTATVLTLDPADPALDHHRPGAHPLFGTAMGIGALVAAARAAGACGDRCRLAAIGVHEAYVLDRPGLHRLNVGIGPGGAGTVGSIRADGGERVHFTATFAGLPDAGDTPPPSPAQPSPGAVDGGTVYRAFFHGPAFQVIGAAWSAPDGLFARLAPPRVPDPFAPAPRADLLWPLVRLIEFGLQSAGLNELATSGRMMIPAAIERLDIHDFAALDPARPVFAHARPASGPPTGPAGAAGADSASDIVVWADPARPLLRIGGYRTVALPFPAEAAPIAELTRRLRESARA